ncbi:MAG: Type secretion system domain [Solirubrobacterales bacterium]|nr:Type secretion system domain [Solirubrobacterales bacterium]
MLILALLALALGGLAVAALVWSLALPRTRAAARIEDLGAYGYAAAVPLLANDELEPADGPLTALARRLGDIVGDRLGTVKEADLRQLLVAAGMYRTSARTLLGYRVLAAVGLGAFGLLIGNNLFMRVAAALFTGFCGWMLTLAYVRRRGQARALEIEREVPNLIDQLVVTIEAGVGFSSSLQMSAGRFKGALGEEMRLTLQEQRMGVALTDSLTNLRERVDSPNLKSFVRAVVQGEKLGVSIGHVMRELGIDMRKRRRQMAEEQAAKTPVKMLLPLVFLILPTMFIVLLAPPLITLMNGWGS